MKATLTIPLEIKGLASKEFEGHGSIFGNVDLGGDIVIPGAFAKSLDRHQNDGTMPQMFWMHDPKQVPGMWLEMREDDRGLAVKGVFADTALGRDTRTLAQMKAVRGMSIGYWVESQSDIGFDKQGNRLLKNVRLEEVSLVSMPMNPRAMVEAIKSEFPDPRSLEQHLRELGCSKSDARELVHDIRFGVMPTDEEKSQCDAGDDDVTEAVDATVNKIIAGMIRYRR